jgi:serine/threonine protein kinase
VKNKPSHLLIWSALSLVLVCSASLRPLAENGLLVIGQPASAHAAGEFFESKPEAPEGLVAKVKAMAAAALAKVGVNPEAAQLYAKWIIGAPALVVFVLLIMIFRPRRKTAPESANPLPTSRPAATTKPRPTTPHPSGPGPEPASDKERVLNFFFHLFRQQSGADPDAPTQLVLIETRPTCPNETYEMRVMLGNDWSSRRMSIGLLGQGGGSRSKCFYVIYDSHMVLKIPAQPIPYFSKYHQQIADEARIVSRLAPRECIVPRISVILKAIRTIPGSKNMSDDELEERYVQLLKGDPSYQEYLMIGPSFAFFMDLAKHFFLSTTLDEIHRGSQRLVIEALKHHELLWDQHSFVCRYGEEAGAVCHDLQEAYYKSESRMRRLIEEANVGDKVSAFEFKQWFVTHLAGEKIDPDEYKLPHELIERINRLMFKTIKNNRQHVELYRAQVRAYIKETRFSQHRSQIENLAANTLDLLAWIGEKGLALRDLKPENLFVAGNPEMYPVFLNDTEQFSIGLIDVETAVVIDAADADKIPQPQLAGTPLYATPSHLISNIILHQIYKDLRAILHLQDWYATIAIIYKIICGENLFSTTARVFPEIIKRVKLLDPGGPDLESDVARINRLFWNSAQAEFQEVLIRKRDIINRVEVKVPEALLPDIIETLHHDCDAIAGALAKTVSEQTIFAGKEKCQFLMDAPAKKISKMKNKLSREGRYEDSASQKRRDLAMEMLSRIERLKSRLERKLEAAAALKTSGAPIGADQLLDAMFQRVFSAMYLSRWPALTPEKWRGTADLPDDITTYQATM